jgi:spermidine synthase
VTSKTRARKTAEHPEPSTAAADYSLLRFYFPFFFASGFCSLVYEVVWLRLAMAKFGVTTPLISIVLSLFMAGLAIGSWAAGRFFLSRTDRPPSFFLRLYALAELCIGVSALVVPWALEAGRRALSGWGGGSWDSSSYYTASGLFVALALLPFCACMGATFPLAMSSLKTSVPRASRTSFSYLYLANVLGACAGTLASAFVLIELLGFQRTQYATALLNVLVAAGAGALSFSPRLPSPRLANSQPARSYGSSAKAAAPTAPATPAAPVATAPRAALPLLFLTGLASLAMEVTWIRQFTPYLGPVVYSFASVLAVYLAANALGSRLYRKLAAREPQAWSSDERWVLVAVGFFSLLPLLAADPRLPLGGSTFALFLRIAFGIAPFCVALGFLTPLLLDRWSGGDPDRAGTAYALNVIGCILGPLVAGFWLLPWIGERLTLIVLGLPILAAGLASLFMRSAEAREEARAGAQVAGAQAAAGMQATAAGPRAVSPNARWIAVACLGAAALILMMGTQDYVSHYFPGAVIRRDNTATVVAAGEGMNKQLLINGYGITSLTPITKMMAHLPAAFLPAPPRKSLVICFGMGTSFRSLLSWGGQTTVVELVPSVPSLFGYFFSDGEALLASPLAEVVIDDGRRFLERTQAQYDVITIDPPPPVEAAASSLLYSKDFYAVLEKRLAPGGIVQQWIPEGEMIFFSAATRALTETFTHVRAFRSVEGWGLHLLASDSPIPVLPAPVLAGRMPPAAAADLVEWGPYPTAEVQINAVLRQEVVVESVLRADPKAPTLEDDRPVNEYYFLRRLKTPWPPVAPGSPGK